MSTEEGLILAALVGAFVPVMCFYAWWLITYDKRHQASAQKNHLYWQTGLALEMARVSLPEQPRYEVEVVDWGSDFTGQDGILPRFRWAVWDGDRKMKKALEVLPESEDGEPLVGFDIPFMLGNEPTYYAAWVAAMRWVEQTRHPYRIVVAQ